VLGLAWSLAHPVVLMLVYLFVFSVMLKIQPANTDHYWLFLLAGLPVWVFFATSVQSASRSLLENANLIRKVRFPRQLVPLSMVATQLVGFAVMLAIVLALSLVYVPGARDTAWLALPLAALVVCLVAGFSLAVASLNAIYRDVEHLVAALLLPWFFLTPVLYSLEAIPAVEDHPRLVDVIHYGNPLTPAVEAVRDPLYYGVLPAAGDVLYLAVAAVVSLALGALVFIRVDDRVAVEV
jgi:lipopolysaccharide transport system permease protein